MGKKFSRCIRQGHSRDLPTDNKLAEWPRNKFSARRVFAPVAAEWYDTALRCPPKAFGAARRLTTVHLPEGDGLGGSLPDSIMVGRIGPIPSKLVLRGRTELLRWTGVSLFTGLAVAATVGFGAGAFWASGSRVWLDCELGWVLNPSAARAPAARISSSVRLAAADFLARDFDFRGAGTGVSEGSSSGAWTACFGGSGVCLKGSVFFSRATITSCA